MDTQRGPTGPEDPTPGQEMDLTSGQYDELRQFVPRKHGTVRLRDRGAAWKEVQLLDAEGNVTTSWPLAPVRAVESHRSRLRWLRKINAEIDAERKSEAEGK